MLTISSSSDRKCMHGPATWLRFPENLFLTIIYWVESSVCGFLRLIVAQTGAMKHVGPFTTYVFENCSTSNCSPRWTVNGQGQQYGGILVCVFSLVSIMFVSPSARQQQQQAKTQRKNEERSQAPCEENGEKFYYCLIAEKLTYML